MVLLDVSEGDSMKVAEKIRLSIHQITIKLPEGVLQKTISLGISGFPTDTGTLSGVVSNLLTWRSLGKGGKPQQERKIKRNRCDVGRPGSKLSVSLLYLYMALFATRSRILLSCISHLVV